MVSRHESGSRALRDCTTSQRSVAISSARAGWSPVMTFLPLPRTFYKQSELIPRHNHGGTQTNFRSLKNDEWDVSTWSTALGALKALEHCEHWSTGSTGCHE